MRLAESIIRAFGRRRPVPPYTHTITPHEGPEPFLTVDRVGPLLDFAVAMDRLAATVAAGEWIPPADGPWGVQSGGFMGADAHTVEHDKPYQLEVCWRCDEVPIERHDPVGLCDPCKAILRDLTSSPVSEEGTPVSSATIAVYDRDPWRYYFALGDPPLPLFPWVGPVEGVVDDRLGDGVVTVHYRAVMDEGDPSLVRDVEILRTEYHRAAEAANPRVSIFDTPA